MNNVKKCFYTGGWDSTYMILDYLKCGYDVQPIYVYDDKRRSSNKELETMNNIIDLIRSNTEYKDNLLDLSIIRLVDIKVRKEIMDAYEKIKNKVYIGYQYVWLSEISKKNELISVGIEKPSGEYSGCVEAINTFGVLTNYDEERVINKEKSTPELITLMGNFAFPIINITEREMAENIKKWRFEYIMEKIWFCHTPINGKPCGLCRPCQQKMECQMSHLLPDSAQKRYFINKKINKILGNKAGKIYIKVIRKINKIFIK